MKVPCYKQEFWYSCFATCVKMILEYYGIKKSERDMRLLLKTTPRFGTIWPIAETEIKQLGFELRWKKFWNLDEISVLIKQSIPIITGIKREGEIHGHAIVIIDISDNHVFAADPQAGEIVKFNGDEFSELWDGRDNIAGYIKKI